MVELKPPSFMSLRVLIVEYDSALADSLSNLLRTDGHEVVICTDRHAASDLLGSTDEVFDIALVDGDSDGPAWVEFVPQLRAHSANVGLISISEFAGQIEASSVHRYGAEAVLNIPFGAVDMRRTVARVYGPRYLAKMACARELERQCTSA
jgi:DNA-binding NtrC family response regulator